MATKTKDKSKVTGTNLVKIGDALPEMPARTRTESYSDIVANLVAIQAEPGEWFQVWSWASGMGSANKPAGARKAEIAFTSGKVELPEAEGEYEVEARPGIVDGKRKGSVLYARYDLPESA